MLLDFASGQHKAAISQVVGGVQPMQVDALPAFQKAKSASDPGTPQTAPHLEP